MDIDRYPLKIRLPHFSKLDGKIKQLLRELAASLQSDSVQLHSVGCSILKILI